MGNHQKKHILASHLPKPKLHTMLKSNNWTWPHLLYACPTPHIKKVRISRDNKVVHQISHRFTLNKYTRCYTLVNLGNQDSQPQDNIILEWLLQCTCLSAACTCMAPMRQSILCAPPTTTPPITPTSTNTIHFKEFTYCHDIFPTTVVNKKSNKYDPLVQAIRDKGWIVNPLITITAEAIHKSSILKYPQERSKHSSDTYKN